MGNLLSEFFPYGIPDIYLKVPPGSIPYFAMWNDNDFS